MLFLKNIVCRFSVDLNFYIRNVEFPKQEIFLRNPIKKKLFTKLFKILDRNSIKQKLMLNMIFFNQKAQNYFKTV